MATAGVPGPGKPEKKRYFGLSVEAWGVIGSVAGVIAAIVALTQLAHGPSSNGGGNINYSPHNGQSAKGVHSSPPSHGTTGGGAADPPVLTTPVTISSEDLTRALLPAQTLGRTAAVNFTGTDLSQVYGICGAPLSGGAQAAGFELLQDSQTNQSLLETIVEWDTAADAGTAISDDRTAVDQSGSCSYTSDGETVEYQGDYSASPPPSCPNPGNYFDTQVFVTPTGFTPGFESGFNAEVQCGAFTIVIQAEGGPGAGVDQATADGYLSDAVNAFAAAAL